MTARWLDGTENDVKDFVDKNRANSAQDYDGNWVFLARNDWHLNKTAEDFPKLKFLKTKQN